MDLFRLDPILKAALQNARLTTYSPYGRGRNVPYTISCLTANSCPGRSSCDEDLHEDMAELSAVSQEPQAVPPKGYSTPRPNRPFLEQNNYSRSRTLRPGGLAHCAGGIPMKQVRRKTPKPAIS